MAETDGSNSSASFERREWTLLGIFLVMQFMLGAAVSLQPPLYPLEATKKGVSASIYGIILGFYYLSSFIGIPIISIFLINRKIGGWPFGLRTCYLSLYFITAACVILYGFLDFIDTAWIFILFSFVLRTVDGIGAIGMCACFSAICLVFPKRIALVTSLCETLYYGSTVLGPVLGEMLLTVGGYITPFVVFGLIMLCFNLIGCVWLPELPEIHTVLVCDMYYVIGAGFISTNLGADLVQFNLSSIQIGLMFALMGLPLVTSPLWGFGSDRTGQGELFALIGSLIAAVGITFVGPVSFIPITPTVGTTAIGLLLFGTGQGALLGSNFYNIVHAGRINQSELRAEISIVGASGYYVLAGTLGSFLGPTVAGVMFDFLGFRKSLVLLWVCYVGVCIVLLVVLFPKKNQNDRVEIAVLLPGYSEASEFKPLLPKTDADPRHNT